MVSILKRPEIGFHDSKKRSEKKKEKKRKTKNRYYPLGIRGSKRLGVEIMVPHRTVFLPRGISVLDFRQVGHFVQINAE